ncbi:tripartite tricarboxylate transporter substrate binding protein [Roseococcus sp. SDR]|uniref:Bug family tripartite tricarboxylate transporter substrate binding protein n=1 Tax=Roseococcus sp. SDR TaxID=2835532 RepID=UPI001BCDAD5B|nr:tripartite tricarboxylate transporter substrate-binding protein [Roseococcus sp. SDR]MBS7792411.1 tripartite tricarboxylate transporter substrate binding protein [Roseococcus sp. SDR]MBV1847725.1 tripartite tricarboxylate transporter substrate binding protein [Roseococcus sp. SDR]
MQRRSLLTAAALLPAFAPAAGAQTRFANLSMFIPAGPGGGWDGLGRAIEQVARPAGLVGNFQFENVGGAGGIVGLPRFISQRRGRPDALMVAGSVMVGAVLTNRSPMGLSNVTPIARMTQEVGVIVVPASSEIRDIAGLLAAFRANPGGTSVGGGSAGGTDHITLGMILKALGRNAREGSYVAFAGGGPAQAAILGAQVKAGISGYSEFAEQIRSGRMRALATTGETRSDPAIPTLKESGVDVVTANWRGVFGAPGINANQRAALVNLMTELNALPAWRELLTTRGWDNAFLPGAEFERFLAADIAATETVLKELGLAG